MTDAGGLTVDLLAGDERALARAITVIENRSAGYRDLVSSLHGAGGDAAVVGVTGSPGAGKSTLLDGLVRAARDRGETVAVVAVDPSSPFSGGSVLGDRVRMASARDDPGVFVRSMSARGSLGGLAAATTDAVTALDAYGFDRVFVETVGAGQNEVEVVRAADTVAVLVPPGTGDDVQMLKAGILEVADVFVVNKADLAGADRTVSELRAMLERRPTDGWEPRVVETVATEGRGVDDLLAALDDHGNYLRETGGLADRRRARYAAQVRTLLREDAGRLLEQSLDRRGGFDALVDRVAARETDPYAAAADALGPLADCLSGAPGASDGND